MKFGRMMPLLKEIELKQVVGHWEMDTVESNRAGRSCLLVLTERMTRQETTRKLPDQTRASVVAAIDQLEYKFGDLFPLIFKSITIDNGSEFQDCEGIEKSKLFEGQRTKLFFCHPYSSFERGSNEKQNQMLRRHFPKGTNFDLVEDEDVEWATDWLNYYPRKIFDWGNSETFFNKEVLTLCAL